MNLSRACASIVICLAAAGIALGAQRRMPLPMLCQNAERIVVAEVTGSHLTTAEWPGLGPLLTTVFEVKVSETWKGATAETLEVQVPGGIDLENERGVRVSGAPVLLRGEKVLLFLDEIASPRADGGTTLRVYGLEQGKYTVFVSRVDGRPGMPIDEDILLAPLKKRVTTILAEQAKARSSEGGER